MHVLRIETVEEKMKVSSKIMIIVCVCLLACVPAVSASNLKVESDPPGAQVFYKVSGDSAYTNPGVTNLTIAVPGTPNINYDVYVTLDGYITPPVQTQLVGAGTTTFVFGLVAATPAIPTPEFPSMALPVGLVVGLLGAVLFMKSTKEN